MNNKRGQFYLIAAVIIISVVIGFAAIRNYAKVQVQGTRIYDIGNELKIETGNVYDYGTYNKKDTSVLIENWTERYYNYIKNESISGDLILLYGNSEELTALTFKTKESGRVSIISGAGNIDIVIDEKTIKGKGKLRNVGEMVNISFNNLNYDFKLREGENLFFVIRAGGYSKYG